MSIAQEIYRLTLERVGEDRCASVVGVGVEIGDDAGVEADNLLFWLEILLEDHPFRGARPHFHRVKGNVLRVSYLEVDDGGQED